LTTVAILQSNYIPWKGYFDIIHRADLFVFLDHVQYTNRDWRNRNRIKTPNGPQWLSIPVGSSTNRRINEVVIPDKAWQQEHWNAIKIHYAKAAYFHRYASWFEAVYKNTEWTSLSLLNQTLIRHIALELLGCTTRFLDSGELKVRGRKQEGLLEILREVGAKRYLSGPSGRNYISEEDFEKENIRLEYMDYRGYPEYAQFHPPFTHEVTVLDLLFHIGPDAPSYIWGNNNTRRESV